MLDVIGIESVDDLYKDVPDNVRLKKDYDLPSSQSEIEIRRKLAEFGKLNKQLVCFAGAGAYDHYTPAVIPQIVERSEFLTSYTPYQAEISQGTLHYIFEYQTMMARLTGMATIGHASIILYDTVAVRLLYDEASHSTLSQCLVERREVGCAIDCG